MARAYRARRWTVAAVDPAVCLELVQGLGITPVTAQILYNRGLTTPEAAREFLECGRQRLHDPFLLRDMDRAAGLLKEHAAAGRPILVYGDYDVDGVTGTAILVEVLRRLGARVDYRIPNRFAEGYGLNLAAVRQAAAEGYACILSVDTGISALAEAAAARELGLCLVVTDHHEPGPELPAAAAVVNPKRPDCSYPFKGLAGAGVAFKLAQALLGRDDPFLWDLLDIVALATVADMVPLVGENRSLVKEGLARLAQPRRPGLAALKEVSGLERSQAVSAGHIAFGLGPRLNALGRMGDARAGVELLLTPDPERALELARHLDAENRSRQETEAAILAEALAQWEQQRPEEKEFCIVLAGEGWHPGVVGICAAKVVEHAYRPAILLSVSGDEARGSARSIPGFHMYRALYACRDLFTRFGGHAMAAGMTLAARDVPELRARLNRLAQEWLTPDDLTPRLEVDACVLPEQVDAALAAELARLEPYGLGNPPPVLALGDLAVVESRPVGKEAKHLKLRLRAGERVYDAIGWGLAGPGAPGALPPGARVQVAFQPELNEWNGNRRLQLVLADLRPGASAPQGELEAALLAWDPLADLGAEPPAAPAPWPALPLPEPAEGAEGPATPVDGVAALAARGRVLVLCNSPWALAPVAAALGEALRPLGGAVQVWLPGRPCPAPAPHRPEAVLAAWGTPLAPAGAFAAAVAWHPPFHLGQALAAGQAAGAVYAAWQPRDPDLAGVLLGWPYPGRPELVRLFKLLREQPGPIRPADLAARLAGSGHEPVGPWNRLRVHAGARVLAEIGLVGGLAGDFLHILPRADDQRGKMNLEDSPRYRRGLAGRAALARCLDFVRTCAIPVP